MVAVRAKRAGWNEHLTREQEFDLDSYEHDTDDLEGELEIIDVPAFQYLPAMKVYLVGGQEADPETIKEVGE